jgi:LCP family protein required for cell wall assembly
MWTRLSIVIGVLVMVVSGLTLTVPTLLARWAFGDVDQIDAIPPELLRTDISGPINFLLLGLDERKEGPDSGSPARSDTMVLVHVPASHDKVYMISLPRDLLVEIPASGGVSYPEKLTHAFGDGAVDQNGERDASLAGRERGAKLTVQTLSHNVARNGGGVFKLNGLAIIDFEGFESVLNALGGVEMCIDQDVWSIHYRADGTLDDGTFWAQIGREAETRPLRYHYRKGECRAMQPWEALDYSRQRYGLPKTDYDRQRHQQQLLKAIVGKAMSTDTLTNLGTIARLRDAAGNLFKLDLGDNPIEDWVFTMRNVRAESIVMIDTYAGNFHGVRLDERTGEACGTEPEDQAHCLAYERFEPELAQLLAATQNGTVQAFLDVHPDWLADDAGAATN